MTHRPYETGFRRLMRILGRRKWLIVLTAAGTLIPVVYYNHRATPVYEAVTTVIFERNRNPLSQDISLGFGSEFFRKTFLTNQIQEIQSRSVSEDVVEALPEEIRRTLASNTTAPNAVRSRDLARWIRKRLSAEIRRNSEIIDISFRSSDPRICQTVLNTLTDVLRRRALLLRQEEMGSVRNFLEEQVKVFREQLDEAERALRDFKERNRITSLPQESQEILRRVTEAEVLYNQAKTNRGSTEERLRVVREKLQEQRRDLVPSVTQLTSPWVRELRQQLTALEVQYTNLLVQGYSEDHPKLVELRNEIDETKRRLSEETMRLAQSENVIDPLSQMQEFVQEAIRLEIELETYQAKERALKQVIDGYDAILQGLPQKEFELAQLTREREVNDKIYLMLLEKREEARIEEAVKLGNMRVIDPAELPEKPVSPRKKLNLVLALVFGLSIGVGLAFVIETTHSTLRTADEIESATGLPVLGSVPRIRTGSVSPEVSEDGRARFLLSDRRSYRLLAAEAFRTLRTNLLFASESGQNCRSLLVTSAGPQEGKSVVAANLSVTLAQAHARVLLIDADLRKPVLHSLFGLPRQPGLSDLLEAAGELEEVLVQKERLRLEMSRRPVRAYESGLANAPPEAPRPVLPERELHSRLRVALREVAQPSKTDYLDVLTCGSPRFAPTEMFVGNAIRSVLTVARNCYQFVVIDSPPVIAVSDAVLLGCLVDGVALVVRSGRNDEEILKKAIVALERSKSKLVGAIVNDVVEKELYGRYRSYYRYYEHEKEDA